MHPDPSPLDQAPRCNAQTRRGTLCQSPTIRGKLRCRMHGGADGVGAPEGNRNARKHGHYTAEAIACRRKVAALLRICREHLAGRLK